MPEAYEQLARQVTNISKMPESSTKAELVRIAHTLIDGRLQRHEITGAVRERLLAILNRPIEE